MKKEKSLIGLGLLFLLGFVIISIFTFSRSSQLIEDGYLASEGSAAENFAVLTASNLHLTNSQVENLKSMTYSELQTSSENEYLRKMMDNRNFASKVDYAYVMIHLPENEVKYQVTEATSERFDAPIDTNLDIMWLLDVNVSDDTSGNSSDELSRYSYYIDEDQKIFGDSPSYIFNSSEWGDHICGYSPLYSEEGTYIGVVGVELQTHNYNNYRNQAMFAMGILLTVATVTLLLLFFFLYRKYKKLQYDKIYTDPLTHIRNRSYYNDSFIKYMNAQRRPDGCFALMIADLDLFKKVNDTFGHETGDQVLIELGEILLETFGKGHVVRFGGEEFVVGAWYKDESHLQEKIDELLNKIRTHKFSRRQLDITLSLGCSYYYPTEDLTGWLLSGMLRAADCELYTVKENGRNRSLTTLYDHTKNYEKK